MISNLNRKVRKIFYLFFWDKKKRKEKQAIQRTVLTQMAILFSSSMQGIHLDNTQGKNAPLNGSNFLSLILCSWPVALAVIAILMQNVLLLCLF